MAKLDQDVSDAPSWLTPQRIELDRERDALVVEREDWDTAWSPAVASHRDLLFDFLALDRAEPDDVLAFAQVWGVLELCADHEKPVGHEVRQAPPPGSPTPEGLRFARGLGRNPHIEGMGYDEPPCDAGEWRGDTYREPLKAWRAFSGQAGAMLSLAEKLRRHSPGGPEDWEPMNSPSVLPGVDINDRFTTGHRGRRDETGRFIDSGAPSRSEQVEERRRALASAIDAWLAWGGVRAVNTWGMGSDERDQQTVRLQGRGLFGALALQLNLEMAGRHNWATCINCGIPYLPKRAPREGETTYCTRVDCQKARNRDNVKRHREKNQ